MTDRPLRIVIVDDHPLMRAGISLALQYHARLEVVGEADNGQDAVTLAMRLQPDIMLLDIIMPDGSGLEALAKVVRVAPRTRVIMLTASEETQDLLTAMETGARAYVLKDAPSDELAKVIHSVMGGQTYITPELAINAIQRMSGDEPPREPVLLQELTPREQEVLSRVAQGLTNREIGQALDMAEKTVKHHMTAIMRKLNVRSRVEAALLAQKLNLS